MVRVTEQAATAIQDLLADNAAPPDAGIRLSANAGGNVGMGIDTPRPGDEVITRDETPLLIMDSSLSAKITDMVIDVRDGSENGQSAGGFVLRSKLVGE